MKKLFSIVTSLMIFTTLVFAFASSGPNFPTAATGTTSAVGGGSVTWGNPTNIEAADSVKSVCNLPNASISNQISDDLIGTGFGFSIPAGSTINGILLEINVNQNSLVGGGANENSIRLLKAGSAAGIDKSTGAVPPVAATTVSYGGSADLWTTTWTPSDINNANFGAAASYINTNATNAKTVSVDFFRITVTFTPPATNSSGFLKLFSKSNTPPKQQSQTRGLNGFRSITY